MSTKMAQVLKIAVPVAVALAVGGVFWLKQSSNQAAAVDSRTQALKTNPSTASTSSVVQQPTAVIDSGTLLITNPIDFDALRSSGLPVLIDFGADSCIPCKEMAPVLAELNKSLEGRAIIRFVDVWKYRDLAEGIPLQVIPTQVLFDSKGKPFTPPDSLKIEFNMYSVRDTNEHVFTAHEGGLDKAQMLALLTAMGMK